VIHGYYAQLVDAEPSLGVLVEKFGASAVWQAGVEGLGYPPTWATNGVELVQLNQILSKGM
jgi:hypothetical protein